ATLRKPAGGTTPATTGSTRRNGAGNQGPIFHNIYYAPKRSAIGQAPARSAHPAIFFRHIVPPIEPPHLTHPACLERGIERGLGCLIAHAFARKDRDGRDALGRILVAVPRDAKDCPAAFERYSRVASEALVRGQRENEPTAFGEAIEPGIGRPGGAGVDQDDVGRLERDLRAVALNDTNVSLCR